MHEADLLFRPLQTSNLTLNNRVVMAPMTRCCSPNGVPNEEVASYYRRRAEGGIGLIISEGAWIPHSGAANEINAPRFYGSDALAGWANVLQGVHQAGAKMVPQLWHVGQQTKPVMPSLYSSDFGRLDPAQVGPSGVAGGVGQANELLGQPMSEREIHAVIEAYAIAAVSAQTLGFDGVELHGAHGYLIDQFLWNETNLRSDNYGGDIARRTRFGVDVVKEIRRRVGPEFPIILRYSQWKLQDYTARLASSPADLARMLIPFVDAGVDIFHCSQRRFWEPEFDDSNLNLAGWTKKITGKPTITVGSVSLDTDMIASLVEASLGFTTSISQLLDMMERDEFDLVAIGRAAIADPDWCNKIANGQMNKLNRFVPSMLAKLF